MATIPQAAGGREMTVGSVLGRAFAAIGTAPLPFFGISLVLVALPATALGAVTRSSLLPDGAGPPRFDLLVPALFGTLAVWMILYMAVQAVLIRATVAAMDGRRPAWGAYAAAALRAMPGLVALAILLTLAVWVGSIFLFVPGVMLALIWSVAAPALVAERCGVFAAFGRSRRLTKGARWRILGLVLVVFVVYLMASGVVGAGSIAAGGLARPATATDASSVLARILSVVIQTAFVTIWTTVQSALYVELRDWKDGPAGERLADIFA